MRSIRRQAGLSFSALMIIIAVAAFLGIIAIKLIPVYLEYYTVVDVLEQVASQRGVKTEPRSAVWDKINKRLSINNVKSVKSDNFQIKADGRDVTYIIQYEVRKPILGNVDAVVVFNKQVKAN